MKKLLLCVLFIVQQSQAIIVNYTKMVSPNGKTVHLFGDLHVGHEETIKSQQAILEPFLLKNRKAILYVDSFAGILITKDVVKKQLGKMIEQGEAEEFMILATQGLEQSLYVIAEFALTHNLQIRKDNRFVQFKNMIEFFEEATDSIDRFEADIFEADILLDCQDNGGEDVIVFAGLLHTIKLESRLKEAGFAGQELRGANLIMKEWFAIMPSIQSTTVQNTCNEMDNVEQSIEGCELFVRKVQERIWVEFIKHFQPLTTDELKAIE